MPAEAIVTVMGGQPGAPVQLSACWDVQVEGTMPDDVPAPTLTSLGIWLSLMRYFSIIFHFPDNSMPG